MKSIPTRYDGVQFRSRLEARWAAMFDCLGWEWAYEPFDMPGWIPDFGVQRPDGGQDILVEVKPHLTLDLRDWQPDVEKVQRSLERCNAVLDYEVWFLGARIDMGRDNSCGYRIGCADSAVFFSHWSDESIQIIGHRASENCLVYDMWSWSGCHVASLTKEHIHFEDVTLEVRKHWITAGNQVQWRAPK